jgi:hypothetical protein
MQGYVNNLEELEKRIISPLKASSHSFISEKEVGVLFSNLESITCLNIQVLTTVTATHHPPPTTEDKEGNDTATDGLAGMGWAGLELMRLGVVVAAAAVGWGLRYVAFYLLYIYTHMLWYHRSWS